MTEQRPPTLTLAARAARSILACLVLLQLSTASGAFGQDAEPVPAEAELAPTDAFLAPGGTSPLLQGPVAEDPANLARSLNTLSALRESRDAKKAILAELHDDYDPKVDGELRLQQLAHIRSVQAELDKLQYDFETVATGIDVRAFNLGVDEEIDLMGELTNFLQPLITELREATAAPRELERLRKLLASVEESEAMAKSAGQSIEILIAAAEDPELRAALEASRKSWVARATEIRNQRTVAEFQLERNLENRRSVIDSTRSALADFFRARGLHLFVALCTFLGIFFGLRWVYRLIRKFVPQFNKSDRPFYARLVDVLYFTLSGLLAVGGALLVLYFAGDWAVLGIAMLGLLGLGWASKTALPMFFEQVNLLLNLGPVRENERVIVNGLPYRVKRVSLHSDLSNPALSGGKLRLPLRDLPALRSRGGSTDEPWFPTSTGDWVLLPDERLAKVHRQTPELVFLKILGGATLCYPTIDFLSAGVENLSGGFRVNLQFGVDYQHQAISTTEIPAKMREQLIERLSEMLPEGTLIKLRVEFCEAAASSLDYAILADFDGSQASRHNELKRAISRILVDTCTDQEWGIPFLQVTLHGAV
jgi:hypothetical protein